MFLKDFHLDNILKDFHLDNTPKIKNKFYLHMLHLRKMHKDS